MEKLFTAIAKGNYKLKISNTITRSKYSAGVLALKLQYIGMCMVQEEMYEDCGNGYVVELNARQIISLFGDKSKHIYEQLRMSAKELKDCEIGYTNPDTKRFDYLPLYNDVSYHKGTFVMVFNKAVTSFLFHLRNKYCLLKSDVMMSLRSPYSYKLYEYLRSNCYRRSFEGADPDDNKYEILVNISELKYEMGIFDASNDKVVSILKSALHPNFEKAEKTANENKYVNWSHFRVCLAKIVKEINDCEGSDIEISYKKQGHSNYIRFFITLKNQKKQERDTVAETQKTAVITETAGMLASYPVTPNGLKSIASEAKYDLGVIKDAYDVMCKCKNVQNPVGFMRMAIRRQLKPMERDTGFLANRQSWGRKYSSAFYKELEQMIAI
ncbi:MAG: replication initiation protein [Oscillospiraceae bacterium]|nr:replication initiation protein [Oscillospiraceae bacterium]